MPSTVIAMDAIAAMEGHRELAIPPAFMNVVRECLSYASPTWQTTENARKEAYQLDVHNLGKLRHAKL